MDFTRVNLTNVYRGLDNVVLVIRPIHADADAGGSDGAAPAAAANETTPLPPPPRALLIASHYDSAVCSTGETCCY